MKFNTFILLGRKKNVSLFPLDFTQYLVTVGNNCSKRVLQIYSNSRGKRKFNPRKYGFHIMNHGIARFIYLSIGLDVTSKSGGGGGGSQKSFPSYSLFCGLFQTPSQSLKSIFLLQFFPFLNLSLPEFFPTLKIPKMYDPILWKIEPIIVNPVTKKRPHPAVHSHRPFNRKHPPPSAEQNKRTKELSGIHKLSLVYFRSDFSWKGGGGASNLGWRRYLFVSPIRVWFQVVQNLCHHKKKWCTVLLASILLCDEDVTLALPCVCVAPCRCKGGQSFFKKSVTKKAGMNKIPC